METTELTRVLQYCALVGWFMINVRTCDEELVDEEEGVEVSWEVKVNNKVNGGPSAEQL